MSSGVRLRPITEEDLPVLRRFHTEPDALGEHEWTGFSDPGSVDRRFREDGFLGSERGRLIATTEDGQTPAGMVTWARVRHGEGEGSWCWNVGIALLPEHRGQGIGTAAQRLLADYLFDNTPAERLEAGTDVENLAEQRALEKAGFRREGVMRSAHFQHGTYRDLVLYSRLRGDVTGRPR